MRKAFLKAIFLVLAVATCVLMISVAAFATDPPHDSANLVSCNSCHTLHNAPGKKLTSDASNANLCLSCHKSGGTASGKPFADSMQADPGIKGTSHSWGASMPATSSPGNAYGLRNVGDISNAVLKTQLQMYGGVVVCSVCHAQHTQRAWAWDPDSSTGYTVGTTNDRHFQRIDNDYNEMCVDCHYYRALSYTQASGDDGGYPADGTNVFSHPVGEMLNSTGYDNAAPLDANGQPQTGAPRFAGDADGNATNNIVLSNTPSGTGTGKVYCLSCHRVHYVDSNPITADVP